MDVLISNGGFVLLLLKWGIWPYDSERGLGSSLEVFKGGSSNNWWLKRNRMCDITDVKLCKSHQSLNLWHLCCIAVSCRELRTGTERNNSEISSVVLHQLLFWLASLYFNDVNSFIFRVYTSGLDRFPVTPSPFSDSSNRLGNQHRYHALNLDQSAISSKQEILKPRLKL